MRISKLEKLNKKIAELNKVMDTEQYNLQMLIKVFTDYKIETVSEAEAIYALTKNDIETIIDLENKKPNDIEQNIWDKAIDYVGALEIQYKNYLKLLDEQETLNPLAM